MVTGLQMVQRMYPSAVVRVEETGEYVLQGTGELHIDCMMHDLRLVYGQLEVRISDPSVCFRETVAAESALTCVAETPNKRNQVSMMSQPLDEGLAEEVEVAQITLEGERELLEKHLQNSHGWDLLAVRGLWAMHATNVLINDTLPDEVDTKLLQEAKQAVIQGFEWACREGPLCGEPIRAVKFKLLDATIAVEEAMRSGG